MQPTTGRLLIRFVSKKKDSDIILADINGQEKKGPKHLTGDFFIEKVGKNCDEELKVDQKVTLRDIYYKIPVELDKANTKKGIYHMLIDQSEVWGYE